MRQIVLLLNAQNTVTFSHVVSVGPWSTGAGMSLTNRRYRSDITAAPCGTLASKVKEVDNVERNLTWIDLLERK